MNCTRLQSIREAKYHFPGVTTTASINSHSIPTSTTYKMAIRHYLKTRHPVSHLSRGPLSTFTSSQNVKERLIELLKTKDDFDVTVYSRMLNPVRLLELASNGKAWPLIRSPPSALGNNATLRC